MSSLSTIATAAEALRAGRVDAATLAEQSLDAIARFGEPTNAFILVDADGARAAAREADAERRRGVDRGPLHGIPISLKDLIDVAGQPTTAASKVRADHRAKNDAAVVTRLREAGAVLIGKTNLHEFALGTTSEDSGWGPVRHPRDGSRSPGGSSGGSAAAVATGMGLASVGSDTGGSIRIPSAACGLVGLKPTIGEVPTDGVVPLSLTLDHVGPIAANTQDAAWLFAVLSGGDITPLDAPSARLVSLGLVGGYFMSLVADDVRAAWTAALEQLTRAGFPTSTREISGADKIVETYVNLALPEAAWWHQPYLDARADLYHPNIRTRLQSGRDITAANYLKARHTRQALTLAVDAALEGCHALALPTLPIVAPPIGAADVVVNGATGETMPVRSAMLRLTQLFNITGHPAISLPMPVPAGGWPVGLQLVGRRGATEELLMVARACEAALDGGRAS